MEKRTIFVTGFSKNVTKYQLEIYFQSKKKSGGGDIESLKVEDEEAVVVFDEYEGTEVAQRVLGRKGKHELDGIPLTVSGISFRSRHKEEERRTIKVEGIPSTATEDDLIHYFENVKRSDGGDVEQASIDGEIAIVKFVSLGVAERVVDCRNHRIGGSLVTVSFTPSQSTCSHGTTILENVWKV